MAGGYLADRYSKRSVTIGTKLLEIGSHGIFRSRALADAELPMECAGVFLISTEGRYLGLRSTDCCRNCFPSSAFPGATGSSSSGRFSAASAARWPRGSWRAISRARGDCRLSAAGLYVLRTGASLGISRVPAADPRRNFAGIRSAISATQMKIICADRVLGWAVLGNTYLFSCGAAAIHDHDLRARCASRG